MSNLSRWGVDFSYSRPTGAELKAAGATAVMLYITDPGPGNKGVSQAVIDDLSAHKIAYGFVWELGTNAALKGYAQGVADAKNAQANLNALHGPSNRRPLYFALDWDVQPDEYAAVTQYFRGIASVIGVNRTGAYGHYKVLQWLTAAKAIKKRWQTYAWSGGRVYSPLDVYQYNNGQKLGSGTVDYCHFNRTGNWGQRGVILAKPAPKPVVAPAKADAKVTYKVKSGDTLTTIAKKYGTTVAAILHLNPKITDPDVIGVGQSLRVK